MHIPPKEGPEPVLNKNPHMQFLIRNFIQGFPTKYISQDASQPWLMFWTIQSFSTLQVALDPGNKQRSVGSFVSVIWILGLIYYFGGLQRTIDTIMAWQHPEGGFGGGPGQSAHLLATYASICSLAVAGRPGPGGGWDQIDL
jgi:protein farnesyltransferase subunit beta